MRDFPPDMELVRELPSRGRFRSVLFDFDGTLSLIREGWPEVMIPMMVSILRSTPAAEPEEELYPKMEEMVMRLTGRQTIYQMIQLAEEVSRRGGVPKDPLQYKHQYHDLLMERIRSRLQALESGRARPEDWLVSGSLPLLEALKRQNVTLYLASGTDVKYVLHEARLLGLIPYFGDNIHGAVDDYWNFSKKMVIDRIIRENGLSGEELLGLGDGYVEIEEVKRVGGAAIGVASDEARRQGVHPWKRERLIRAGADAIIPDYRHAEELVSWWFG